jgi:ABC-type dipeptide/oligopeptide/nickel transport system ATPase component
VRDWCASIIDARPRGALPGGQILSRRAHRRSSYEALRKVRGRSIGAIFQDPR